MTVKVYKIYEVCRKPSSKLSLVSKTEDLVTQLLHRLKLYTPPPPGRQQHKEKKSTKKKEGQANVMFSDRSMGNISQERRGKIRLKYQFTNKYGDKSISHLTRKHHNSCIPMKWEQRNVKNMKYGSIQQIFL